MYSKSEATNHGKIRDEEVAKIFNICKKGFPQQEKAKNINEKN